MRLFIGFAISLFVLCSPILAQQPVKPDVPKAVIGDRNETNKKLMALSESDCRTFLYVILNTSHESCAEVTRTFYQGSAKPSWNAIWNVSCRGGPSYVIQVMSDEQGSAKVLTCGQLRAMGGGECFRKLE
jgi:hypothetical protein